jgi:hypothetical protein
MSGETHFEAKFEQIAVLREIGRCGKRKHAGCRHITINPGQTLVLVDIISRD